MLICTHSYSGPVGQQVNTYITLNSDADYNGEVHIDCPAPCCFLLSKFPQGELTIGYAYTIPEGQEDHTVTVSLVDTIGIMIKGVVVSAA
jgi:hypothetical protein